MASQNDSPGFTLIELMVVVIIIAALAGMVLPRLLPHADRAKRDIARGSIASIETALKSYYLDNQHYPKTLDKLMKKTGSAKNWNGPYLEKAPLDPWKRPFGYKYPGQNNASSFDIWSKGPNVEDGSDDVTNWEQ
ncbi:MAG: type II secretion system major pseudopilin GspG [Proteobacteria bacterium]|nr:type II secretion system major pseudopilin GspG [Pseudomonadota bacterium]